jgi:uncharacterized protein YjgD (DUF1641 family)
MEQVTVNGTELAALTAQVQALTAQVEALTELTATMAERSRAQAVRQQEWDEFKADFTPVVNDLYLTTVNELAELEPHVRLEDLLHLVKRLARNTRNFEQMLDQLESLQDFVSDFMPLTDQLVHSLVLQMAEMEKQGYFAFAREGLGIADRIVTSFSEEDVRQLGDNVVLILNTVKAMTQPEIMNMVNNITVTYREVESDPELRTGMLDLVRQMRDPEVRRGLALTMRMLQSVAHQPDDARPVPGPQS